jgi:hypothetical protein
MHLGFSTGNYQVIHQGGQFLHDSQWLRPIDSKRELRVKTEQFKRYCTNFPDSVNHNIWYDFKNKSPFSQAQYRYGPAGKDHHFNQDKAGFLKSREWGLKAAMAIANLWGFHDTDMILANNDIVYGNHEKIEQFKNKSVLIVCGGPSVDTVGWENLNYDYIWSCNQFFMNDKVAEHKVDLVTVIAGLFDYNSDERFLKYIKDNDTLVSFELERGGWKTHSAEFLKTAEFCKEHRDNSTFFHTRYRGQLGVGLRLVVYAAMLGFKDIYIVGLDGRFEVERDGSLLHAFETNKPVPNWYKNFGNDFQDRQMIIFWEYIMELKRVYYPDMSVHNLGQDAEYNVLSRLFKQSHPLPEDIRKQINGRL